MTNAHDIGTAAIALLGAVLAILVALRPLFVAATAALRAYETSRNPNAADPPLPTATPTDWQVATWVTLTDALKHAGDIASSMADGKGIAEKTSALAGVDLGAVVGGIDAATDFVRAVAALRKDHDDATFARVTGEAHRLAEALAHSVRWGASQDVTVLAAAKVVASSTTDAGAATTKATKA
jgi:hypothetical protein